MNCHLHRPQPRGTRAARRWFLEQCGIGLGRIGLASLVAQASGRVGEAASSGSPSPERPGSFGRAKAVIHLFMAGAPSHLDLFDFKPDLARLDGQPLPPSVIGDQRYAFIRSDAAVMAPRFPFASYGQSGLALGEPLAPLGQVADELCLVRSMTTDQFNHAPAQIFFNTGFAQPGRACMGSWVTYALGAEARDLPAFVVLSTGAGISGGSANWSAGFLPTRFAGVRLRNQGDLILNLTNPPGIDAEAQRDSLDLIQALNRRQFSQSEDPEIEARIAGYEMAHRLQTSAPELLDLASETPATLALYGCDPQQPSFARACLLARRMVERGVRFINIYHEGWDAHSDLIGNHRTHGAATAQATAALIQDLRQRGMLESTLVIWGGEFGRTPMVESNAALGRSLGRDHHPQAFSVLMAGGGIKAGYVHGATDEFGFHIVENRVHVHDLQATILHCLGLDHRTLTFPFRGLDVRLTGVEEHHPVLDIVA